ncbi:MAG: PKD domain-containing protein [Clostridiaceae bacterium]|nr:PKD domain-containing protein [Clostridiaceae bacterium]
MTRSMKRFFVLLTAIALFVFPILVTNQVSAETIFTDGFETGDFSKWNPVVGTPAVTSGDAHDGTYKAILDASGEYAQVRFTLEPRNYVCMRSYVMFKTFPASGTETAVLGVYNLSGIYMAEARIRNVGGTVKWALRYYNGGHNTVVSNQGQPIELNKWYCIEVEGLSGSATGGESRIFIDGNELTDVSKTGLNNTSLINCGYIWDNNSTAVRWYDCVVIADAPIGPENEAPVANANGPYSVDEGSSIVLDAAGSSDPDGDALTYAWDLDNNSTYETSGSTATFSAAASDGPASLTVGLQVTDEHGLQAFSTAAVNVNNVAPTLNLPTVSPASAGNIYQMGGQLTLSGTLTDPGVADTFNINIDWGDGTESIPVSSGSNPHAYSVNKSYSSAGIYNVKVTVADDDSGVSNQQDIQIVIYDPSAGFVTGGGWINSLPGAYLPDPSLSGKASFGFVSKYKKGAAVPVGQTEFQFRVANLNFHSETYQWLVVAGSKAQYKGTGTLNGVEGYGFIIFATDGSPDKFRIKIWDADEVIIYDNMSGTADDASNVQEIGGGSIVIHK